MAEIRSVKVTVACVNYAMCPSCGDIMLGRIELDTKFQQPIDGYCPAEHKCLNCGIDTLIYREYRVEATLSREEVEKRQSV